MPANDARLDRIERRLDDISGVIAIRGPLLKELRDDVDACVAEIGRVPTVASRGNRKSVSDRLHDLENDRATALAAQAALEASRDARRHAWSTWEKALLFAFAAATPILAALHVAGVG